MAASNAVWGIDVGQCALKAIKLRHAGEGKAEAVAFDIIEHAKILSQPDADPDELIRAALEKFVSRNEIQGDKFVIGVPGQQTFARFCKMPPVDQKKVPDLVRFEASQQIPFDMDDVVWDYQTFATEDSPDLEVGIFAMRKDLIRKHLEHFSGVGIEPSVVQTLPSALYNFLQFERPETEEGSANVIINVGAQNTDLVVVEPNSAWTRNIPLGGNNYTEALVRAFKLSFPKAESLKRSAASSKYARQIFQAMRPIFADLVAEIQRSIGFYSSTHRDVELKRVFAMGNAFQLPGLQKYLENNLTVSGGVHKVDKFNKLVASDVIRQPQFTENILTFGPAYGLALQGLGLTKINATLLPTELARVAIWRRKRPYFIAAAACLGLAAVLPYARAFMDQQALTSPQAEEDLRFTRSAISEAETLKRKFQEVQTNTTAQEKNIQDLLQLREQKRLVPQVLALVHEAMPEPHPALQRVETPEELKQLVESGQLKRTERRQLLVDNVSIEYVEDLGSVELAGMPTDGTLVASGPRSGGRGRPKIAGGVLTGGGAVPVAGRTGRASSGDRKNEGFVVNFSGRLLFGERQGDASRFLADEYYPNLRALASQEGLGFYIPEDTQTDRAFSEPMPTRVVLDTSFSGSRGPRGARGGVMSGGPAIRGEEGTGVEDPVTGEDMSTDWKVDFQFKIKLGEKPEKKEEKKPQTPPGRRP